MKTEMDVMGMDERQRLHWLQANRATLLTVGAVWLLMIAFELSEGRRPEFLIVMVPVLAGLRFGFYYYLARDRDVRWVNCALFIVLVALGHWMATVFAWVQEFTTSGFLWFVPGEPSHGFWLASARVLEFPLGTLFGADANLPDWLGVILVSVNSLLWAGGAFLLIRAARRLRAR